MMSVLIIHSCEIAATISNKAYSNLPTLLSNFTLIPLTLTFVTVAFVRPSLTVFGFITLGKLGIPQSDKISVDSHKTFK